MKLSFNNKLLSVAFAVLMPVAAYAAEGAPVGKGPSPEDRKARMELWCKDNPARCKEMQAKREARMAECKANPAKCKEMKANMEKRRAECQANPEKCRKERMARFEQRFKSADVDGNGMISRVEAEKGMPRLVRRFEQIDANKDGQISRDEMAAARKVFHERRKPRPEASKI